MTHAAEQGQLLDALFGADEKLVNLKFFPSRSGPVLGADIAAAAVIAIRQRRSGSATINERFPETARRVDVRAVVASL